ncbi:hypothetical protein [Lacticaseibacillus rhamnosus]|uniref:hypothetical protein n=1 Tax=Lacticaseibacillus rhamnosus TaxID=47715 RepID=UPI003DA8F331
MNEELKQHALRIAEILQEQGNPYQRIEIDADGIKKISTDWSEPAEISQALKHPVDAKSLAKSISQPIEEEIHGRSQS